MFIVEDFFGCFELFGYGCEVDELFEWLVELY